MKPGRNDTCPCGSGKKYKRCCGRESESEALIALLEQGRLSDAELAARTLLSKQPNEGLPWKVLSAALLRQGKDALAALRRTAELLPYDAEAHNALGCALQGRAQWSEALTSFRRALDLRPDYAESLVHAADVLIVVGRASEAVALYRRALQIDPQWPQGQKILGNTLVALGQYEAALACYRVALANNPNDAGAHSNLGNALGHLGRLQESIASSRQAIALDPSLSEAHNNLGLALSALGYFEEAAEGFRQALRARPNYVDALNNLGNALLDLGQPSEALSSYGLAIALEADNALSRRNLGNALLNLRRLEEAAATYRQAIALNPKLASAHLGLAMVLRLQGHATDAEANCRTALAIEPDFTEALSLLGVLRADQGQFSEAEELFKRIIAINADFPDAWSGIANNRKMTVADASWLQGAQQLVAKRLPLKHQIGLRFALGKYFDDLKEYPRAFDNYRLANELSKRYAIPFDRAQLTERVDAIIRGFSAASISHNQLVANLSERPVLIVGMPRSGTSLSEQILASHPAVFGAGEVSFWDAAFADYAGVDGNGKTGASLIPQLTASYLDRLASLSSDALRVVDKMPANFMNLGLIHSAFPKAKIIHMRRHPIDTCLSIYFQHFFNMGPFANDLDDLAYYYREYQRISDHWRAVLPSASLLEVPYEALVDDQETWSRRMVDFIGLPWDPQCLDFHKTERVVLTTSKWQVRQKIHSSSAGRWKHYQPFIGPLQHLLADSLP